MNELKCKECGAILAQGTKECPSCGCPVDEVKIETVKTASIQAKKSFNVVSIVSLIIGIAIIIMGVIVMNKEVSVNTYIAKNYDASSAKFGGDFYTSIYGASDTIVDELDDVNGGVAMMTQSMKSIASLVSYSIGMMIIAIGLGVVAVSLNYMKR